MEMKYNNSMCSAKAVNLDYFSQFSIIVYGKIAYTDIYSQVQGQGKIFLIRHASSIADTNRYTQTQKELLPLSYLSKKNK